MTDREREHTISNVFRHISGVPRDIQERAVKSFSRLIQNTEMVLEDFWDSALSNQEFDQSQAFICQRIIYKTLNEII